MNVDLATPTIPLLQRLFVPRGLRDFVRRTQEQPDPREQPVWERLLKEMNVRYQVSSDDMRRVPLRGPTVVVSNHPFGLLDGAILATVCTSVRPDVRILTNNVLSEVPELAQLCIAIDPFGGPRATPMNHRGLKQALRWLRQGGLLLIFPAGEVASWQGHARRVVEAPWSTTAARLIARTNATVVPAFVDGSNSPLFHLLGVVHPRLRTLRLAYELWNKHGRAVDVSIGTPIAAATLSRLAGDGEEEATAYLRESTMHLAEAHAATRQGRTVVRPVAPRRPLGAVRAELASLPAAQHLFEDRDFMVFLTDAAQAPELMRELGRVRELTFRAAGEGTGAPRDLDLFDEHYQHLVLWHKQSDQLAGACRICDVQDVLARRGLEGIYTATLFRYHAAFFEQLGPAFELGRSFVAPEHQKHYGALLALWKALARHIAAHPENPTLMGAVSINQHYSAASRELMVRFFGERSADDPLASLVVPHTPLSVATTSSALDCVPPCDDIQALSHAVSALESDRKGVPVLLRHYVKLGGRLLAFNVDRDFANVLDALVVVNLSHSAPRVLGRYMGEEACAGFLTAVREQACATARRPRKAAGERHLFVV